MAKQYYWFKVWFGKWEEGVFNDQDSCVFVDAWDAVHAIRKAVKEYEETEDDVVTGVEYLGYPQA